MYRELSYKVKEYELLCSLISANELVTWADNIILNEDDLDEIIIGLSLTNNAKKQYGILSNLSTKHESKAFSIVTNKIAKLYENNILGFYEISNKLISMNCHSINLSNHQVK